MADHEGDDRQGQRRSRAQQYDQAMAPEGGRGSGGVEPQSLILSSSAQQRCGADERNESGKSEEKYTGA